MIEVLKYSLPTLIALFFAYLMVVAFVSNDRKKKHLELLTKNGPLAMQLQMQALERITILMERIHPLGVATLLYQQQLTVTDLQLLSIRQIRNEYEHNLSQQIYVSPEIWEKIRDAKEETLTLISEAAKSCNPQDNAKSLLKEITQLLSDRDTYLPTQKVLIDLKKEAKSILKVN